MKYKYQLLFSTCIIIVILGAIPAQIILSSTQLDIAKSNIVDDNVERLKGENKEYMPRLMNEKQISDSDEMKDLQEINDQSNRFNPNFAIGQQQGTGGGSYYVYDSFNWTGTELIDTQNELYLESYGYIPTERNHSISITNPTDFSKQYQYFNISNIQAKEDWRLYVDFNDSCDQIRDSRPTGSSGDQWYTIAISFEIEEDFINLSEIQTFTYEQGFNPEGEVWIEGNGTDGKPNGTVLSDVVPLGTLDGWNKYTFSQILLPKGGYFVVMNDSDGNANWYWDWYIMSDSPTTGDGDDLNRVLYRDSYGPVPVWGEPKDAFDYYYDAPLQLKVNPVEYNGSHWNSKEYDLINDVKIWYNTTASEVLLDDSTWFKANDTTSHLFKSNTSVSFDFNFVANYTYSSNPISAIPTYSVSNNSVTNWNLTFSTAKLNTTYNIRNHTIKISDLKSDWNGTFIYWNDTQEYFDLEYNDNITLDGNSSNKYSNGSSVMVVNASTLAENTTWRVWFDAPNYLYDFNLSLGGTNLNLPYETYTMNDYSLDFEVYETGNLTYWIDYPNSSQYIRKNISSLTTINDIWDIDSTFDSTTRMNGTYQLQAFYNNSDLTKVGTYTRNVTMYVNTSFSQVAEAQVIIGQLFNATAYYTADHNGDTDILNAPIWCDINWTSSSDKYMTQNVTDDSYNASFATDSETEGTVGNLTIITQMPWFENWTETILVFFVKNSTLNVNADDLSLEWRENYTLEIKYNVTPGGENISSATITVNNTAVTNYTNGVYYFEFNTTDYNGVGSYLNLKVNASHINYTTRIWYFNLTITDGITNIAGTYNGLPHNNKTDLATQYFSNSSADTFTLSLRYYHILTADTLKTTTPTVDSNVPNSLPSEEGNNNWTITFDPDSTGVFVINISFSMSNYTNALFMFNVTIFNARTNLQTGYENNTDVYYGKSYEFAIFFNNTDWDENITFNGFGPINIDDPDKVDFLNRTGDLYWFNFSYNSIFIDIATHSITITFTLTDFQSSSLLVHFDVIPSPFVDLTGVDANNGTSLTNITSTYTKHYSPNEYDNFSISISYFANITSQILDNIPVVSTNSTIWYDSTEQGNYNWTFIFNGSALGTFLINITFSHENYTSLTFTVQYIIQTTDTQITNQSVNPIPSQTDVISGNTFDFWLIWQSEYYENINDSMLEGNGTSTNISLLSSNPSTGNHTFRLTAPNIGIYTYNLTFLITNYTRTVFLVRFNITRRTFRIDDALSRPANGSTPIQVKFGNVHNFSVFLRDLITNNPIDVSNIVASTNISFISVSPSGNHTFNYTANQQGSFNLLTINFSLSNYYNISYYVSFTVYDRFMYMNATFSKHDSGVTIDTLQYGELYYFTVFLMDNETEIPVNATIKSIDSGINFMGVLNDGNHSFYYNATSLGDFLNLQIVLNSTNYNDVIYIISFEVSSRVMTLDQGLTTYGSPPVTINYLQYGDLFYFYIYLNDSRTNEILNISSFSSLPTNVNFENFSLAQGHLFRYHAIEIDTSIISNIDFVINYYITYTYQIIFTTVEAESELIITSSSISTYYTVDVGFSIVWQSIPNIQVSTSPTLRINDNNPSFQFGLPIWVNNVQFIGKNNGNFTFSIIANQTGSFTVTISFGSSNFENRSILITINVLQVPTLIGGSTSPANGSVIGGTTLLYYSKTYDFDIQWIESLNNSGIVDSSALLSGSGMSYLSNIYQTSANGVHQFTYHANSTGTYRVIVTLGTTNFADLVFELTFIVTTMPTNPLIADNIDFNKSILVEEVLYINGSGFETFESELVPTISVVSLWINGSVVPEQEFDMINDHNQFWINFATEGYRWGAYNMTIRLEATGYQFQSLNFNVTLQGREIRVTLDIPQDNIIWGDDVDIMALLEYINPQTVGIGSSINLASLEGVDVSFRVIIEYKNGSTSTFEDDIQTDASHEATYTIAGQNTQSAVRFTEISVLIASSFSGLPFSFNMLPDDFPPIQPPTSQQLIDLILFLLPFIIVGLVVFAVSATVYRYRKRKKVRVLTESRVVEQSFEDIKSIRLILARHESGLQFYSESTIADLATDTDALSGMSAAISSFMEEVSGGMASRSGEAKPREIEMMSREGLHMLIWHGNRSSLIIISETRLPDYFQERLKGLGSTLEKKYGAELLNFYSSDQIPSTVVKKMVRKFIPLHYFSAFILNEGVLTLESIKLSGKEKKMLKIMKEIQFVKDGIQFFFSEQIISQLSKKWKRSEAIKFLNKSIDLNLLIEASQEDLLDRQK